MSLQKILYLASVWVTSLPERGRKQQESPLLFLNRLFASLAIRSLLDIPLVDFTKPTSTSQSFSNKCIVNCKDTIRSSLDPPKI